MTDFNVLDFVRGLDQCEPPFELTDVRRENEEDAVTCTLEFIDSLEIDTVRGEIEVDIVDIRLRVIWTEETHTLGFSLLARSDIPADNYGWTLEQVNLMNAAGHGLISKIQVIPPESEDEFMYLNIGWECALHEDKDFKGRRLAALRTFFTNQIVRLCAEVHQICIDLDDWFSKHRPN